MTETHHIAASAIGRLSLRPPAIWIVSGPPTEHRRTVASTLLAQLDRSVHVSGDALAEAIVRGYVAPGKEPRDEAERQAELSIRNQCLLARSYAEAGFTPVLEYAVLTRSHLDAYRHYLSGGQIRLLIAVAEDDRSAAAELLRTELAGLGRWAPAGEDGPTIVAAEAEASIS
ncbi:MAG: hypothetical protein O3A10_14670 [Chloroflexi bacterium]|nr:hypothetical protein [Chloroflexota bacterium]MDA1147684.1 hypothetical protein [Chloroflexota bacterium]